MKLVAIFDLNSDNNVSLTYYLRIFENENFKQ